MSIITSNRRDFLKAMSLVVAVLLTPGLRVTATAVVGNNPNIIFIMADDMGIGDTTVYNPDSRIPTPNLERLAGQGVVFTDAHSPSAMCTPTRYSLLTGRYCLRTWKWRGVYGGYDRPLVEKGRMTIASLLKDHNYATACIGKWHLGMDWMSKDGTVPPYNSDYEQMNVDFTRPIKEGPTTRGFDYFFGTSGCTTDDPPMCFIENDRVTAVPTMICPEDPADEGRELLMVPGWRHGDADVEFTRKAVSWIEKQVRTTPDKPFFLYLPYSVPHIPWLPPRRVKGKSDAGPRGDQVVLVDWGLGEIMRTLDRLAIRGNTLLIFTSDNGPRAGVNGHQSSGPYRGQKGDLLEGGHRMPFVVRWPEKAKSGTICNELICFTDMMATFAAIVGAELPDGAGEDSFNILPALLGEKLDKPIRNSVIHHNSWVAIRRGEWKLNPNIAGNGQPGGGERRSLFNISRDPYERNNLYAQHPEIVEALTALLRKQMKQGYTRPMKD